MIFEEPNPVLARPHVRADVAEQVVFVLAVARDMKGQAVCLHHRAEPLDDGKHRVGQRRPRLREAGHAEDIRLERIPLEHPRDACLPPSGRKRGGDRGVQCADEVRAGRTHHLGGQGIRVELAHQFPDPLLPMVTDSLVVAAVHACRPTPYSIARSPGGFGDPTSSWQPIASAC